MNVRQQLSILFYLKRKKASMDGMVPIYVRLTIRGMEDEFSMGIKIHPQHWQNETKTVSDDCPDAESTNKQIRQVRTDLERHFDLMVAKHETVTPNLIIRSYKQPTASELSNKWKTEVALVSQAIDCLINDYLAYCKQVRKATNYQEPLRAEKVNLLAIEEQEILKRIEIVTKQANRVYDQKELPKTFVMAMDEHLFHFMQMAFAGNRSPNSLEKMIGRKRRFLEFLAYRYKASDLLLSGLEFSFLSNLTNYLLVHYKVVENTAMKYAQCFKEIMARALANGWITSNVFSLFAVSYNDPDHDWLSMEEPQRLKNWTFKLEKLNIIRDIVVFACFTGLSYQELYTLSPEDLKVGIDQKLWLSKDRQKTKGDESLPLLPIAKDILEKYKDYPVCVRKNSLLQVPTNQEFNRCLKLIGKEMGIDIILQTHKNRYFFANEVTYNKGVPLKTVSRMLGHKSVKTTEIYVRANKRNISESMEMVESKLFDVEGKLKSRLQQLPNKGPLNNELPGDRPTIGVLKVAYIAST